MHSSQSVLLNDILTERDSYDRLYQSTGFEYFRALADMYTDLYEIFEIVS